MRNYEQSPSEAKQGGICSYTRDGITQRILNSIDSEEKQKKTDGKRAEALKTFGNDSVRISELRKEGMTDRISIIPLDLTKYENEQDKNSYRAGFVENGNRILVGNLEKLSDEQLENYGRNDYISGVKLSEVPDNIKEKTSYSTGYMMASIMDNKKTKGGRK